MIRRNFLKWSGALIGAVGLGALIGNYWKKICRVTIIDFPNYSTDVVGDICSTMTSDGLLLKDKRVLLKPNFVEVHPGRPINTDVSVIRQVSEACWRLGAREVAVGEAAGHRRDPWFSVINPAVRGSLSKETRCIDLNHGRAVRVKNRGKYTGLEDFLVAADLMEADVVINLPKLKTHHWVGVTLSMKNLFGVLPGVFYGWPKNFLHYKGIPQSIIDLAMTIPVHYIVLDAGIGMEGDGPILGSGKAVGALIMGTDPLAIDTTGARIMGFDPNRLPYMSVASYHFPGFNESAKLYPREHPKKYFSQFTRLETFEPAKISSPW